MIKSQKYINYVVNDLVSNTELDFDNERIVFPEFFEEYVLFQVVYQTLNNKWPPYGAFYVILEEKYGVHEDEEEMIQEIWFNYVGIMGEMINDGRLSRIDPDHINESTTKKEKYINYIIDDIYKKINLRDVPKGFLVSFPFEYWLMEVTLHHTKSFPVEVGAFIDLGKVIYNFHDEEYNVGQSGLLDYIQSNYGAKGTELDEVHLGIINKIIDGIKNSV